MGTNTKTMYASIMNLAILLYRSCDCTIPVHIFANILRELSEHSLDIHCTREKRNIERMKKLIYPHFILVS